ncbi:MAG TPA: DUF302 domain-containing protein [Candidatus Acidoferrum sp.]|nr:DUF302 domain-containing protein [Candidatus Acidoferrum sp.]
MRKIGRLTAAAFITLAACSAGAIVSHADDVSSNRKISESSSTHVNIGTQKSFDAVTSAIEKQLGKYDGAAIAQAIAAKLPPEEIESKIHAMEGSSGFMLFTVRDHGQLLSLKGKQAFARQYEIGNPLIAIEMTQDDLRAAEYAPLRVLVYVGDDHMTHIDYDLPSTVFGRLHSTGVDKVAKSLDDKLGALIANALKD